MKMFCFDQLGAKTHQVQIAVYLGVGSVNRTSKTINFKKCEVKLLLSAQTGADAVIKQHSYNATERLAMCLCVCVIEMKDVRVQVGYGAGVQR